MLKQMARLVGAVLGTCFVLAMAATMAGSERWLAAWALAAGAVALLVGALTNPRATASTGAVLLGAGLIAGGRPMEGVGVLTLLAAAALNRPAATDTTTE